ncbi:hypothetical protein [Pseudoxanthomonas kaohsiungensis]|uniref:Uncharacterized protein n=1 Tax=Pseudoxanthomonas kaohsiungensis TaxID=283923 RepID=A0ABW3M001_9GAMM|nr:hypothetical protein [Pseudoxanthomonas kaohsiungensis]
MIANENPFSLLRASTRDRKTHLNELAEEAALHGDHDSAVDARNILSNPRTRLAAEVAWFPGLSPKRITQTLEHIARGGSPELDGFNALSCANFLVETLEACSKAGPVELREGIEVLASYVEEIDVDDVLQAINEDRQAAGLPAVADPSLIEAQINERVKHYERIATALLEDLPSMEMVEVYEGLISDSTNAGEDAGHRLIDALIDSYELKASSYLSEEAARIKGLIEKAKTAADRHVAERQVRASVNEIIDALRTWDRVAQPIQLAYKSRGIDHDESQDLAFTARGLGIHLFNKHDYLDDAKLMSEALQELFSEVTAVSDRVDEDIEALEGIVIERAQQRRSEAASEAEFAKEITYETEFGFIFKDKFRISPAGFDYKGSLIPLDQITGVRWGAVKKSTNGIPTGTDYYFGYGTSATSVLLQPNSSQYQAIIQRAWRAVCIRILLGWMDDWSKGRKVNIAGVEVSDDGLILRRSRIFKEDEAKFFSWFDVSKSAYDGSLNFYGKPEKKFSASFSYKDGWNVHVLDFAIDRIWEGKASKLSKIFGQ